MRYIINMGFILKKFKIKNLAAAFTAAAFLISAVLGDFAYAAPVPYNGGGYNFIPADLGNVSGYKNFNSQDIVINIQDLHTHPETQKVIFQILQSLNKKYKIKNIYLEGAWGKNIDASWLNSFSDKKLSRAFLDELLNRGYICGTEYFAATSGVKIQGLENRALYAGTVKSLAQIISTREDANSALSGLFAELNTMQKAYLNARQASLLNLSRKYANGKIDDKRFYLILNRFAQKAGYDTSAFPAVNAYIEALNYNLNEKTAGAALTAFLNSLKSEIPYKNYAALMRRSNNFQNVYELVPVIEEHSKSARLLSFARYVKAQKQVDMFSLNAQTKELLRGLYAHVAQTRFQKDVSFLAAFYDTVKSYTLADITYNEAEYFNRDKDKFDNLFNLYKFNSGFEGLEYLSELQNYYRLNTRRDRTFMENLLPSLSNSALGDKEITVVITGGFHTPALLTALEKHKISHLSVMPNISGVGIEGAKRRHENAILAAAELKAAVKPAMPTQMPAAQVAPMVAEAARAAAQKQNVSTETAEKLIEEVLEKKPAYGETAQEASATETIPAAEMPAVKNKVFTKLRVASILDAHFKDKNSALYNIYTMFVAPVWEVILPMLIVFGSVKIIGIVFFSALAPGAIPLGIMAGVLVVGAVGYVLLQSVYNKLALQINATPASLKTLTALSAITAAAFFIFAPLAVVVRVGYNVMVSTNFIDYLRYLRLETQAKQKVDILFNKMNYNVAARAENFYDNLQTALNSGLLHGGARDAALKYIKDYETLGEKPNIKQLSAVITDFYNSWTALNVKDKGLSFINSFCNDYGQEYKKRGGELKKVNKFTSITTAMLTLAQTARGADNETFENNFPIYEKLLSFDGAESFDFSNELVEKVNIISSVLSVNVGKSLIDFALKTNLTGEELKAELSQNKSVYREIVSSPDIFADTPREIVNQIVSGNISFKENVLGYEDAVEHNINNTRKDADVVPKLTSLLNLLLNIQSASGKNLNHYFKPYINERTIEDLLTDDTTETKGVKVMPSAQKIEFYADEIVKAASDMLTGGELSENRLREIAAALESFHYVKNSNNAQTADIDVDKDIEFQLAALNTDAYEIGDILGDCTSSTGINRKNYRTKWLTNKTYKVIEVWVRGEFVMQIDYVEGTYNGRRSVFVNGLETIPGFRDGTSSLIKYKNIAYYKALEFIGNIEKANGKHNIFITEVSNDLSIGALAKTAADSTQLMGAKIKIPNIEVLKALWYRVNPVKIAKQIKNEKAKIASFEIKKTKEEQIKDFIKQNLTGKIYAFGNKYAMHIFGGMYLTFQYENKKNEPNFLTWSLSNKLNLTLAQEIDMPEFSKTLQGALLRENILQSAPSNNIDKKLLAGLTEVQISLQNGSVLSGASANYIKSFMDWQNMRILPDGSVAAAFGSYNGKTAAVVYTQDEFKQKISPAAGAQTQTLSAMPQAQKINNLSLIKKILGIMAFTPQGIKSADINAETKTALTDKFNQALKAKEITDMQLFIDNENPAKVYVQAGGYIFSLMLGTSVEIKDYSSKIMLFDSLDNFEIVQNQALADRFKELSITAAADTLLNLKIADTPAAPKGKFLPLGSNARLNYLFSNLLKGLSVEGLRLAATIAPFVMFPFVSPAAVAVIVFGVFSFASFLPLFMQFKNNISELKIKLLNDAPYILGINLLLTAANVAVLIGGVLITVGLASVLTIRGGYDLFAGLPFSPLRYAPKLRFLNFAKPAARTKAEEVSTVKVSFAAINNYIDNSDDIIIQYDFDGTLGTRDMGVVVSGGEQFSVRMDVISGAAVFYVSPQSAETPYDAQGEFVSAAQTLIAKLDTDLVFKGRVLAYSGKMSVADKIASVFFGVRAYRGIGKNFPPIAQINYADVNTIVPYGAGSYNSVPQGENAARYGQNILAAA